MDRITLERDAALLLDHPQPWLDVIGLDEHWLGRFFTRRWLFRQLGMRLGKNVTIASGVTLDYFFPELIEIGDNTIVGMDTMILAHEFLHDRWRCGKVSIGMNVLLGAQSTVLAGVTIGDNVQIAAMSLVNKSVPAGAFVGGVPLRLL